MGHALSHKEHLPRIWSFMPALNRAAVLISHRSWINRQCQSPSNRSQVENLRDVIVTHNSSNAKTNEVTASNSISGNFQLRNTNRPQ
jgi:hypothetical protein